MHDFLTTFEHTVHAHAGAGAARATPPALPSAMMPAQTPETPFTAALNAAAAEHAPDTPLAAPTDSSIRRALRIPSE